MSFSLPTPKYSHLSRDDFEDVYEPAEDSFILLDALELECKNMTDLSPNLCIELGPGSGIISAALSTAFNPCFVLSCDINRKACLATRGTMRENDSQHFDIVHDDGLTSLRHRLSGKVDLFVCNPPYVETPADEEGRQNITAAWAGGCQGTTLTFRVLALLTKILSPNGIALIVFEDCNRPDEVMKKAEENFELRSSIVLKRRAGRELLSVLKFSKL